MNKLRCNLEELLYMLSDAQDLISPLLSKHHRQVAYLAFRIAEQSGLSEKDQREVFVAALVHDIGALSTNELLTITENEPLLSNNHAFKGAALLEGFRPLSALAKLVKFHHIPWHDGEGLTYESESVPFYSHIIHLADRVCAMVHLPNYNILSQMPRILGYVEKQNNQLFVPSFVKALKELSTKEYIWLDLICENPISRLSRDDLFENLTLDINDTLDYAILFSRLIDFRSRFTASHSAGVANVAEQLAQLIGFSPLECKMMLIAGYLHDVGKLSIDNAILEKPGKLDEEEYNQMRSHTYYTYSMLDKIHSFHLIKIWAAYHHERLDGKGYPFHVDGENIPLGARIMAVADVFTAITENRPYRQGMDRERAIRVLDNMVANGALDLDVINILKNNFDTINDMRERQQRKAVFQYQNFLRIKSESNIV